MGLPSWIRVFRDPRSIAHFAAYIGCLLLYIIGTHVPLLAVSNLSAPTERPWWFLELFDRLFTAGAFGGGAVFALGIFGTIALSKRSLISGAPNGRKLWLRWLSLFLLAGVAAVLFYARGMLSDNIKDIALVFVLVSFGGWAVFHINLWMTKLQGPDVLHVNSLLILFQYLVETVQELTLNGAYIELSLLLAELSFLGITALLMLRMRIYLEVQNIKSTSDLRYVTLELKGVDEKTLDTVGHSSVVFFIVAAGLISLILGWRELETSNYAGFTGISILVVLAIWGAIIVASRVLRSSSPMAATVKGLLSTGGVLALQDPARHAQQLIKGYWIIPGIKAGKETEKVIAKRLSGILNKSFFVFAAWFLAVIGVEIYSLSYGTGGIVFPYGPLVFAFLFVLMLTNFSMIARLIRHKGEQLRIESEGKARVVQDTYPLRSPSAIRHLEVDEQSTDYWEEELLMEEMRDFMTWINVSRRIQAPPDQTATPLKSRLWMISGRFISAIFTGLVLAFIGGLAYVLLKPESDDVWAVVVPLFVTGMVTPGVLDQWFKRQPKPDTDEAG